MMKSLLCRAYARDHFLEIFVGAQWIEPWIVFDSLHVPDAFRDCLPQVGDCVARLIQLGICQRAQKPALWLIGPALNYLGEIGSRFVPLRQCQVAVTAMEPVRVYRGVQFDGF